ncbi:MAG: UDP-N-acetylmuramate dehydrogenase [Christensenellaceae bacterium]|nr:UDP-N-acetylmuramate dehydrogenase [Christensenellaceae bacterium]
MKIFDCGGIIKLLEKELLAFDAQSVKYCVPSSKFSTYGGGGSLSISVYAKSASDLLKIAPIAKNLDYPFIVVGACSNILIDDGGFVGLTIMTRTFTGVTVSGSTISANAGERLTKICNVAAHAGLSGLESLYGIPATIGGAVATNAGAFGTEISELIEIVEVLDIKTNKLCKIMGGEIPFKYRNVDRIFENKIILSVVLKLKPGSKDVIDRRIKAVMEMRANSQPQAPSLGCVFKKINGVSAGYYIEKAGLKGATIGNAQISRIHANFIINKGGGNANDYIQLLNLAQNTVYRKFGIMLQKEILIIGEGHNHNCWNYL